MYTVKKVNILNLVALSKVSNILYLCGKDMAERYDLHHWHNSKFKNALIVMICAMKNNIYLVFDGKNAIATFQTKKTENGLNFQKLATSPLFARKGVGSFCMETIENMAREQGCSKVCLEVYDKSNHAMSFYEHRGYSVCGRVNTLKYTEIKMEKVL